MSRAEVQSSQTRAHIRYKNAAGGIVPGVTTITGMIGGSKVDALCSWANKKGLEGINSREYAKEKAVIGTLAHKMVTDYLLQMPTETREYSAYQISAAENSFLSYLEWAKSRAIIPIIVEKPLVSERYQFGGTADIYARVDGILELIDLKTGSGIYDEMIVQACAYKQLLGENGYPVERVRILNIPRDEDEGFSEKVVMDTAPGWEIFLHCLAIYKAWKKIKGA